jgi:hypothetical protein
MSRFRNRKQDLLDAILLAGFALLILWLLTGCSVADRQSAIHGTLVPSSAALAAGLTGGPVAGVAAGVASAATYVAVPSGKEAAKLEAVQETVQALGREEVIQLVDGKVGKVSSSFGGTWFWIGFLTVFVLWRMKVGTGVKKRLAEVEEWFDEVTE